MLSSSRAPIAVCSSAMLPKIQMSIPSLNRMPNVRNAWVIERLGKFHRTLPPGFHFLIPMIDRIAYVHSLKEEAIHVPGQTAITSDNVTIIIDGVLSLVHGTLDSSKLATVPKICILRRSALGQMTLDRTFSERETLNHQIVKAINLASEAWGIVCMRYEIRDITPPPSVRNAMDKQAEAERQKRAHILESEGLRQSDINIAEGKKIADILQAEGEAKAMLTRASASAQSIELIGQALIKPGGKAAMSVRVAEQYVDAFANLAKRSTTMLLPSSASEPSSFVAQALAIYQKIIKDNEKTNAEEPKPIEQSK